MIITDHKVNGLNEALRIEVEADDNPSPGGANHTYYIDRIHPDGGVELFTTLHFQNGPIFKPEDINGITNEAVLAVLIHRMRGFQYQRKEDGSFDFTKPGKFACRENAIALTHMEEALMWLQKRTRDRTARGVEGTLKP